MAEGLRAGFIGLGNMGVRMAQGIIDAGIPLTVWARRPVSVEPFVAQRGVQGAATPAALGAASDVVGVCVWGDADVEEVLTGPDGVLSGMAPGGVVAIHSTVAPATCARLAERAAASGVAVIDAPVSSRPDTTTLLVMVGGDADVVQRCGPVLSSYGDPVVYLGPLGSGQLAKLVNNVVLAASIGLARDALDLGVAFGLDEERLREALLQGSSSKISGMQMLSSQVLRPRPDETDGAGAAARSQTTKWALKDVALTQEEARQRGIDVDRLLLQVGRRGAEVTEGTG